MTLRACACVCVCVCVCGRAGTVLGQFMCKPPLIEMFAPVM